MKSDWSKEEDNLLITLITNGAKVLTLEYKLNRRSGLIVRRLREMGFENLKDARKVLRGN